MRRFVFLLATVLLGIAVMVPSAYAQPPLVQAELPAAEGESAAWRATLARVAESVVSIQIDQVRAFDTEWNTSSQAMSSMRNAG